MKSKSSEVVFDCEPIATKLYFGYNEEDNTNNSKGESAMKYEVTLVNSSCIFDEGRDMTFAEAMDFIKGRGGCYVVHISAAGSEDTVTVSWDDDKGVFLMQDAWGTWEPVTEKEIRSMIKEEEKPVKYTVKNYTIKPEHLDEFGPEAYADTLVPEDEVIRLATDWEISLAEMLEMLVPADPHALGVIDLVRHCIRNHEDFPDVGTITTESAQLMIDNFVSSRSIPQLTAETVRDAWNLLVRDEETFTKEE